MARIALRQIFALLAATASVAGPNADVKLEIETLSPPCALKSNDAIEFLVTARGMQNVRQIKIAITWQPQGVVDNIRVDLPESAQRRGLIAPFPAGVTSRTAEIGLATFGDGLTGDMDLARFTLLLASHVMSTSRLDVWIDEVSLGPSFTERDTLQPTGATVLANYCDERDQVLEHSLLLDPDVQHLQFSSSHRSSILDQSSGEAEMLARLYGNGSLVPNKTITWRVTNLGPSPVSILDGTAVTQVAPGNVHEHTTMANTRGNSTLVIDAGPGPNGLPSTAELLVCAELATNVLCGVGVIHWESANPTAVLSRDSSAILPLTLEPSYPNPFNGSTVIRFQIPEPMSSFMVGIYNTVGQRVKLLSDEHPAAGARELTWEGHCEQGTPLASGIYFVVLRAGGTTQSKMITLLR